MIEPRKHPRYALPAGMPVLAPGAADADGLLHLSGEPLPDWTFYDEGPVARCAVAGAPANVPVRFPGGQTRTIRFVPECHFTSCIGLYETPVVFAQG